MNKDSINSLEPAPAEQDVPVQIIAPHGTSAGTRRIAAEVPVSITYNGLAHAVMMATPHDLEDFLVGFSLSEAIVTSADEIEEIDIRPIENGFLASVRVPPSRFDAVAAGRRNVVGQSGCGICGIIEIENIVRPTPTLPPPQAIAASTLFSSLDALRAHQPLNATTGAVHAAAFVSWRGEIRACREDVGRHNALDKLIGHLSRHKVPTASGYFLLSSRCSFELVQKTALAGCPMLVTVSAPTSFALELAQSSGLTLIALARSDAMLCLNDPHRLFSGQD